MSVQWLSRAFAAPDTINGARRLVLLVLADHADEDGLCWPSIGRIARQSGIKRHDTIRAALRSLEADGLITTSVNGSIDRRQRNDRRTNLYRLTLPPADQTTNHDPTETGPPSTGAPQPHDPTRNGPPQTATTPRETSPRPHANRVPNHQGTTTTTPLPPSGDQTGAADDRGEEDPDPVGPTAIAETWLNRLGIRRPPTGAELDAARTALAAGWPPARIVERAVDLPADTRAPAGMARTRVLALAKGPPPAEPVTPPAFTGLDLPDTPAPMPDHLRRRNPAA